MNLLCHTKEQPLYLAIQSCLKSGVHVRVEGEGLLEAENKDSLLFKEEGWEGTCLRDPEGELIEIGFSRRRPSQYPSANNCMERPG